MLGPLWLRVKGWPIGRNESDARGGAPSSTPPAGRPRLPDITNLVDDYRRLGATIAASEDLAGDELRALLHDPFKRIGASFGRFHVILNECEADSRSAIDLIQTARKALGGAKEQLALTLANAGYIELVRALFDDPEGLEADLYVDHIERRAAEARGPVPAPDLKGALPQGSGSGSGGEAGPSNDPDPGGQQN
jgi:hypothetical protein